MPNNNSQGFWFSYIDVLTGLASIFLILFIAATNNERVITQHQEYLIKNWQSVRKDLVRLNTKPLIDSQMGGIRLTLAEKVLFSFDADTLNRKGEEKIRDISDVLVKLYKLNPGLQNSMRISVGGHTDKIGGDAVNFPLSYNRASNVANIIRNQFSLNDIKVEVTPIAYGSKYPLPGHYSSVEPKNRRTTIVIQFLSTELLKSLKN